MKRFSRCGCCCLLPVLLAGAGGLLWSYQQLQPASTAPRAVRVVIPSGATPRKIARQLQRDGLIRSELAFVWQALRDGKLDKLKSGGYQLSPHMSLSEMVDRLARGGQDLNETAVTIPEGYTLRQVAGALAARGVITDPGKFIRAATQGMPALDLPFRVSAKSLEGYLYPETYRFQPATDPGRAAETMVETFNRQFYAPNRQAIDAGPHSLHELVIIASLVEREARVARDRPLIAGVIENRLKKGMRLEIDATVLYALGHHKDRVLYRDLDVDSPYNTYRNSGLPPGPIANPGRDALMAALHPKKSDYLFYVAAPDGSHRFSRTLAEHNRNVARMRAERRAGQ